MTASPDPNEHDPDERDPIALDSAARLAVLRDQVQACRVAHDRLVEVASVLSDDDVRAPSVLPGWSRGHVLTHVARNGDSVVHLGRAVVAGAVADQYPGGPAQRAGDIEAGAGRPAAALVADVVQVNEQIHATWDAITDAQWLAGSIRTASGREMPATYLPAMRWREVVVHTSDLGLATATWRDWPDDFVASELPGLLELLASRLDGAAARALVAQLMGRREGALDLPSVMW